MDTLSTPQSVHAEAPISPTCSSVAPSDATTASTPTTAATATPATATAATPTPTPTSTPATTTAKAKGGRAAGKGGKGGHGRAHGAGTTPRSCSFCAATQTPMWRHGPGIYVLLCNSCGVKFKRGKILQDVEGPFNGRRLGSNQNSAGDAKTGAADRPTARREKNAAAPSTAAAAAARRDRPSPPGAHAAAAGAAAGMAPSASAAARSERRASHSAAAPATTTNTTSSSSASSAPSASTVAAAAPPSSVAGGRGRRASLLQAQAALKDAARGSAHDRRFVAALDAAVSPSLSLSPPASAAAAHATPPAHAFGDPFARAAAAAMGSVSVTTALVGHLQADAFRPPGPRRSVTAYGAFGGGGGGGGSATSAPGAGPQRTVQDLRLTHPDAALHHDGHLAADLHGLAMASVTRDAAGEALAGSLSPSLTGYHAPYAMMRAHPAHAHPSLHHPHHPHPHPHHQHHHHAHHSLSASLPLHLSIGHHGASLAGAMHSPTSGGAPLAPHSAGAVPTSMASLLPFTSRHDAKHGLAASFGRDDPYAVHAAMHPSSHLLHPYDPRLGAAHPSPSSHAAHALDSTAPSALRGADGLVRDLDGDTPMDLDLDRGLELELGMALRHDDMDMGLAHPGGAHPSAEAAAAAATPHLGMAPYLLAHGAGARADADAADPILFASDMHTLHHAAAPSEADDADPDALASDDGSEHSEHEHHDMPPLSDAYVFDDDEDYDDHESQGNVEDVLDDDGNHDGDDDGSRRHVVDGRDRRRAPHDADARDPLLTPVSAEVRSMASMASGALGAMAISTAAPSMAASAMASPPPTALPSHDAPSMNMLPMHAMMGMLADLPIGMGLMDVEHGMDHPAPHDASLLTAVGAGGATTAATSTRSSPSLAHTPALTMRRPPGSRPGSSAASSAPASRTTSGGRPNAAAAAAASAAAAMAAHAGPGPGHGYGYIPHGHGYSYGHGHGPPASVNVALERPGFPSIPRSAPHGPSSLPIAMSMPMSMPMSMSVPMAGPMAGPKPAAGAAGKHEAAGCMMGQPTLEDLTLALQNLSPQMLSQLVSTIILHTLEQRTQHALLAGQEVALDLKGLNEGCLAQVRAFCLQLGVCR
ncbi:hypothetical protein CXG81DRAFT_19675 [Caulochytrium protostelioides]|uniref:GATA-type domain-containing protein n=1 Tax=Caulochytrium protostelioides TaxID=1555241 RepID=A0A4P9X5P3_9FUNG|nr:hypothetical protein CXG81DRAFT_19675 [Caulochytrium protostelioides]|eukprot:RKP00371.1 hypothetical protein CXG81DRAFT_19675 [Caulochytrium protostelioides]